MEHLSRYNLPEHYASGSDRSGFRARPAIADWMTENELIVNMKKGKTECMLFGMKQKIKEKRLDVILRPNNQQYNGL